MKRYMEYGLGAMVVTLVGLIGLNPDYWSKYPWYPAWFILSVVASWSITYIMALEEVRTGQLEML